MLKGGVIGCGFFAANHLAAWELLDGVEIVAVCDRDPGKAQWDGAKSYTDAAAMLASETLDFVDIITTTETHRPLVELAAGHKVPVICQKPFAPDAGDAQAMVDACRKAGVPLMVHENFRWQSPLMAVKAVLDSGEIGEPSYARIQFRHAYDIYTNQPYLKTEKRLAIMDLGIHVLDLARYYLGEVTRLHCRTQRVNPDVAGEDVVTIILDHASGAVSLVDFSFTTKLSPDPFPETLVRIEGTKGTIELFRGYQLKVSGTGWSREEVVEPDLPSFGAKPWHNIQESVVNIQRHWVDCLKMGRKPATSGADNLKTLDLVFKAYEFGSVGTGAMSDLKGAVIGCGFFAQNHLKAWGDVEGATLAAVCDLDQTKADAAAELTGAKAYTDVDAMLASEQLDFVDIATTMETHEALVEKAAAAGAHVICQKPFAPDIAGVKRILATAEGAGIRIMVHENFRYQTPLIKLKHAIAAIGEPFFAHIAWRTGHDVVAGQPYLAKVERFIILDLGIHVLDVARFLLGDVEDIYARTQRTLPGVVGESQATMSLGHSSGAVSAVTCTYTNRIDPDPFPQTLVEVEGSIGTLRLKRGYQLELHGRGKREVSEVAPSVPSWADPKWALAQESVIITQAHFINCLRSGEDFQTSGRDNLKTFALVEAAYASAASGQPAVPEA